MWSWIKSWDKVSLEAIQVGGKGLMTAKWILRVDFETVKVDQICMLCFMWKLKNYRSVARDEPSLLIAQNQLLMVVYEAQDVKEVKARKEELVYCADDAQFLGLIRTRLVEVVDDGLRQPLSEVLIIFLERVIILSITARSGDELFKIWWDLSGKGF
jgi:hypothetical protein